MEEGTEEDTQPKPATVGADTAKFSLVQAAQYGILARVRQLVEDEGQDCTVGDHEDITPLHWAAINNRGEIARYFINRGANVNAIGGELRSTPLHWATRQGHMPMVILLYKAGANIDAKDGEGLTPLHLASQFGYWPICAYLISLGQDVDCRDDSGMTPLMWACHRSFNTTLAQLLLASNASLSASDKKQGNTPLHFAVMAGNNVVIPLLLKAGARLDPVNAALLTPIQCARQQQSSRLTFAHLERAERQQNNFLDKLFNILHLEPLKSRHAIVAFIPFLLIGLLGYTAHVCTTWLWMIVFWILFLVAGNYLLKGLALDHSDYIDMRPIGLYTSTKVWMYITWFLVFWPYVNTWTIMPIFLVHSVFLWYYFVKTVRLNPGYVKMDVEMQRKVIIELAEIGLLETSSRFCQTCFLLKPIRSKHCAACNRCVAKLDHHCPWVANCVGANNHRHFVLYLMFLLPMICWYFYGSYLYFSQHCSVRTDLPFSKQIFAYGNCSPWVFLLLIQGLFHVLWVTGLTVCQLYQVVYLGATTNERMNASRYAHFHTSKGEVKSPFSRGILGNCVDFFECSLFGLIPYKQTDWHKTYSFDGFVSPDVLSQIESGMASGGSRHGGHGHSHGGRKCCQGGHSHGGHSHGGHSHGGHSHGGHSHGGHRGHSHGDHSHSHGGHFHSGSQDGHSHGDHSHGLF